MKYTYDDIFNFFKIYLDQEYSNKNKFMKRLRDFNVSEAEACLMWQCFDIGVEVLFYNKYEYMQ